ncbi:hypothetical protein MIND_00703500 [Mycena indigotica]|uniref:Uncharacterized protein n=1 Tax=Mycena indigotica TaxID=2126181 RepID=A0A8H6W4F2_9AGAR|nr:uncharacterized protein MIND_00703500 [Mycena indigotica]KAF7301383.1 hypothetical protein MIND_00703500 [Mycena indigotica]
MACSSEFISGAFESKEPRKRVERASTYFNAIFLARLLLFLLFLEAQGGALSEQAKKHWLTLQLEPQRIEGDPFGDADPFEDLSRILLKHDSGSLPREIENTLAKIQVIIGHEPLFLVLDEASDAIDLFSGCNLGDTSALQIALQTWMAVTNNTCPIICAGIAIPPEKFVHGAGSDFQWTSDTGAFDDPIRQGEYVARFLPPTLRNSPEGRFLIARAWRWLRGRHRVTATFVETLIEHFLDEPHRHLDRFIHRLLGFQPVDALTYTRAEPIKEKVQLNFDPLPFTLLPAEYHQHFLQVLYRYMATHAASPPLGSEHVSLIYRGFARFSDKHLSRIALDEPHILLMVARNLFPYPTVPIYGVPHRNPATFIKCLHMNTPQTSEALSQCLVFYITQGLAQGRPLRHIFTFPRHVLQWARQTAELVRFHRLESGEVSWSPVTANEFEQFRPLAYRATSTEETLSWMEHRVGTAFCLTCLPNVDLMFVVRLVDGTFILVALKAIVTEEPFDFSRLQAIFSAMQVDNLSMNLNDAMQLRLKFALDSLPNPTGFQCNFLPAVSSFPDGAHFRVDDDMAQNINGTVLDIAALRLRSGQIMQMDFFDAIVSGVLAGHPRKSDRELDDSTLHTSHMRQPHPQTWPEACWDGPIEIEEQFERNDSNINLERRLVNKGVNRSQGTRDSSLWTGRKVSRQRNKPVSRATKGDDEPSRR